MRLEGHHRDIQKHVFHRHNLAGVLVLYMFVLASTLELRMDLTVGEVWLHMVLLMKVGGLRVARLAEVIGVHQFLLPAVAELREFL